MAECDWLILADYAFADAQGKLCIVGIFDVIFAAEVPATHERAFVGFSVVGEPGELVRFKLGIIGPSGSAVWKADSEFTLPDAGSASGSFEVRNLVLPELGQYAIEADFGGGPPKSAWFTLKPKQARPG